MEWRVGTSGFSYAEWVGPFYPDGTKPAAMLAYYAQHLPSVEINNTFYRMPKRDVLAGWREQVPSSFRFVLKASRRITHIRRLKEAGEEVQYLFSQAEGLDEQLGSILFQLPPNARADRDRLATFLDTLPAEGCATFEFRHPSWFEEEIVTLLAERGHSLCVTDDDTDDDSELDLDSLTFTSRTAYLRLRRATYSDDLLARLASKLVSSPLDTAYVYFKHEDEGAAPKLASRFLSLNPLESTDE